MLHKLPDEVIQHIVSAIEAPSSLLSLIQTCKLAHQLGLAALYRNVEMQSAHRAQLFFDVTTQHPSRTLMLRRLHLCERWLLDRPGADLRTDRALADSAAELIASVVGHLTDLRIEDFELVCQSTTVRHALSRAIMACTRLTRFEFSTRNTYGFGLSPKRFIPLVLSAPVRQLSISAFDILPFSVLDVFKLLAGTLTHVTLSGGDLPKKYNRKLGWACPNVHVLALHHVESSFALVESLFPNVHTLELVHNNNLSYMGYMELNRNHKAQHWKQLRQVTGDMEGVVSLGNLCECVVDRIELTAVAPWNLDVRAENADLTDFLGSASPKLLRVTDELEWQSVVKMLEDVGSKRPSLRMLDLAIAQVSSAIVKKNADALMHALQKLPSLKQLCISLHPIKDELSADLNLSGTLSCEAYCVQS